MKELNRFSKTVALPSAANNSPNNSSSSSLDNRQDLVSEEVENGATYEETLSLQPAANLNSNGSNSSLMQIAPGCADIDKDEDDNGDYTEEDNFDREVEHIQQVAANSYANAQIVVHEAAVDPYENSRRKHQDE